MAAIPVIRDVTGSSPNMMDVLDANDPWAPYIGRYLSGEWRSPIFRDMVLADVRRLGPGPAILDIGCGEGLDGSVELQHTVATVAGRFIGIEPDPTIKLADHFTETHRCPFEQAPLEAGSIDLAYAVMVLEHLPRPQFFWDRLFEVLADGGMVWGLTVDARHPFARCSLWADRLKIKDLYLDRARSSLLLRVGRYKNYPTYYRTNTPAHISGLTRAFRSSQYINFSRVGQWSPYLPRPLRSIVNKIDGLRFRRRRPGTLLAVRVVK